MWLPPEVLERIYAYEKEHSIDRDNLIPAAIKATRRKTGKVVKMMNQYLKDPDSFKWPIKDPLLCASIAFMRACAGWLTRKINEEYGDDEGDEDAPADWWKVGDAE